VIAAATLTTLVSYVFGLDKGGVRPIFRPRFAVVASGHEQPVSIFQ
jgi:hypothetical protein